MCRTIIILLAVLMIFTDDAFANQTVVRDAYSAVSSDCGGLIVASNGFYPITLNAANTYPMDCVIKITNTDPAIGASAAAKWVVVGALNSRFPGTYLWPGQTMDITSIGGSTWQITRHPGLWELPTGLFTINYDPENGSDGLGSADGLQTGSRAFKSAMNALLMQKQFLSQTVVTMKCSINGRTCAGHADSQQIHWPPHGGPVGSQGRDGIILDCSDGTLSNGIEMFFGAAIMEIQNCTVENGVSLNEGAELIINSGTSNNQFVPVSDGYIFTVSGGSRIFNNRAAAINIKGGRGNGLLDLNTGLVNLPPMQQIGNITWSDATVRVQAGGYLAPFNTWTSNGYTVTGVKYRLIQCGAADGTANIPGSLPGSVSCNQAN